MPDQFKPSEIHGVVADDDERSFVLYEDPAYPGHASRVLEPVFRVFLATPGRFVVIVTGTERRLRASADLDGRLEIEDRPDGAFAVNLREDTAP